MIIFFKLSKSKASQASSIFIESTEAARAPASLPADSLPLDDMGAQLLHRGSLSLQLGAVGAAYGVSLLLVVVLVILLSKKRRQHFQAREAYSLYGEPTRPQSLNHRASLAASTEHTSQSPLHELDQKKHFFQTTKSMLYQNRPVSYSPYQPGAFCTPVTVFLETKQDRELTKRMAPVEPVLEMVRSSNDMW